MQQTVEERTKFWLEEDRVRVVCVRERSQNSVEESNQPDKDRDMIKSTRERGTHITHRAQNTLSETARERANEG